jgi:site-specific DNA-methyltransferase (adenine-specific)
VPRIYHGDNLDVMARFPDASVDLVYTDPPFNTGRARTHTRIRTVRDPERGDRTGFGGRRYRSVRLGSRSFDDRFEDYLGWLEPRLEAIHRLLKPTGSLFVHLDPRECHYVKVLLDSIFGRSGFMNEIVWAYDFGGRPRRRWPAKHDTILWYAKEPGRHTFAVDEVDRIPYMAPGLVGPEKAARGKVPTDVWWHTIVPTRGRERTGYPTQKPLGVVSRIVKVHSREGETVLDPFAGSGTVGEAAASLGREWILIDEHPEAIEIMRKRLAFARPEVIEAHAEEARR